MNSKNKKDIFEISIFSIICLISALSLGNFVFGATCNYCCPLPCPGGLVPCGRHCDDPDTLVREDVPCTLCHLFVLLKRLTDFALKNILFPAAVLMLVIGGAMFLSAGGSPEKIVTAKNLLFTTIMGIIIVLASWLIVNTFLYFLTKETTPGGVTAILGNPWNQINCPVPIGALGGCCGDGIVQKPEGGPYPYVFNEECEKTESQAAFFARGGIDLDGDSDVDTVDYVIMQNTCTPYCTIGCKDDPNFGNLGKGCFVPGTACQRGEWVCDLRENSPTYNTIICGDVYSDASFAHTNYTGHPLYDYCCQSIETTGDVIWGQQQLNLLGGLTRIKPPAAVSGVGSYDCDTVCRTQGKVCVGVGIVDDPSQYCFAISCHTGNDCLLSSNHEKKDCRTTYPYYADPDSCQNPEPYHVGYTSCLCR